MPKLIINNLNIKEKNADKNGTTGYRVKIDGGNPIEFRKKYLDLFHQLMLQNKIYNYFNI